MTEFTVTNASDPPDFNEHNFPSGSIIYSVGEVWLLTNWKDLKSKSVARCISLANCGLVDMSEGETGIKLVRKITVELAT